MIQAKLKEGTNTLESFYEQIVEQQLAAHGADYCNQHKAIREHAKGKVYRELGTHQGATAACALLSGATSVTMVDISTKLVSPNFHLFESYANNHDVDIELIEKNSADVTTVGDCDVLLIDSLHTPAHLKKELNIHAPSVREHIILHDTFSKRGLSKVAYELEGWKVLVDEQVNVGYMVLGRE